MIIFFSVTVLIVTGWILMKTDLGQKTLVKPIKPEINVLKVVAAGDISCPDLPVTNTQCQQKSTADLVQKINPDLVLALGDIQYGVAGFDSYLKYYDKSWGVFKDKTRPAVGNHEYEEVNATGYYDYFKTAAGEKYKGYYSFEKNGWKMIALNSNCWAVGGCDENSPQGKWLDQELKSANQNCQLVYFHHPLYSSGQHGINEMVRPLWQIMDKYRVELVLNGHDHIYERFALQDSKGQTDPQGVREFVVGTGGRNLYQIKTVLPNSEKRINDTFGVLKLELKSNSYDWQFISIDNQVLDSGSDSCHFSQTST